jgi:hypothetical protein
VIAIIGPDKARVTEIEQAVRELAATKRNLKLLGPPMGLYRPLNKADKTMAKSIGLAIKRLEQTLDGANVRQLIDRATYTASGDFYEWKAQLKYWRECFEVFGGVAQAEPCNAPRLHTRRRRRRQKRSPPSVPAFRLSARLLAKGDWGFLVTWREKYTPQLSR